MRALRLIHFPIELCGKLRKMIELTTLVGKSIFVNPELIRTCEKTPDTIICFTDGTRMPVRDTPEEITAKMIHFKKQIFSGV